MRFAEYSPTPAVPTEFKHIMAAVAAGGPLAWTDPEGKKGWTGN